MIILLALLAIILFLTVTKTQFFKKEEPSSKFTTQLAMAILVGTITIYTLYSSEWESAFEYTVVGIGIMSFIAILTEMVISKKRETTS
ncbi:hypothetical protein [Lentibacillus juripiscarius]|uniref:Uncharacterized protein n=1 Tax=Lentibacillus juripiscarius TaxID=257446 RepID=A0ABW5V2I7_9BACI